MKKYLKGFILGTIIATLLMGTAIGAGVKKTIEVAFNSINITVNGKKVNADNIVYNGTTYIPLRAAAELLDKEVGWDQKTSTASINDKSVEKPAAKTNETLSQKNAIKSAQSYLEFMAFSKIGLIKQLKYEGYSEEDSTYAVSQITVNWKEQAVKSGKGYLEITPFSRDGLIKQLKYEGFTDEEATYAVDKIGL